MLIITAGSRLARGSLLLLLLLVAPARAGVRGTFWSTETDSGGCQLPQADYQVMDAVALGQNGALGALKWKPAMCGQVLNINCGGKSVQAIVASTCDVGSDNCGIDMIKTTWDKATDNASPGVVSCTVSLSLTHPFKDPKPVCYNRPGTDPSPSYVNIGVLNVGGEMVRDVSINDVQGQQSNGGWFAVNAAGGKTFTPNSTVEFSFESGKKIKFNLSDCKNSSSVHIFK